MEVKPIPNITDQLPPLDWLPDFVLKFITDCTVETLNRSNVMAIQQVIQWIINNLKDVHNEGFQNGFEQGQIFHHHITNCIGPDKQEFIKSIKYLVGLLGVSPEKSFSSLQEITFKTYYSGFYTGHSRGIHYSSNLETENDERIAIERVFKEYYQPKETNQP